MDFASLHAGYEPGQPPIDFLSCLLTSILLGLYSAQPRPLRGASRGVVEAGRTEGEAGEQAILLRWPALGEIPGLGRCGARGRASQARTRAASGLRPGTLRSPARSWLTAAGLGLKARPPAVESAARRRTNAAVERREARWPASLAGDPWRPRDRPDRKAGHGCGVPHQRLSALCPPQRGAHGDDGVPRAAKNRGGGALAFFHPSPSWGGWRAKRAGWGSDTMNTFMTTRRLPTRRLRRPPSP